MNLEQSLTGLGQVVQGIHLRKLLQLYKNNRNTSFSEFFRELKTSCDNINVAELTVYNRLNEAGLASYFAICKPLLNNNHKK